MKVHKIGQRIKVNNEYVLKPIYRKEVVIKKGTEALINSNGDLVFNNGITENKNLKVNGYDTKSIAEYVYKNVDADFDIGHFLFTEEIDKVEFLESIEFAISKLLIDKR